MAQAVRAVLLAMASAVAIMGNHELNALLFHQPRLQLGDALADSGLRQAKAEAALSEAARLGHFGQKDHVVDAFHRGSIVRQVGQ